MSRYINADELLKAINSWQKFGVDERCRIVPWNEDLEPYIHLRDAVMAISGMPTADVVEVVRCKDCTRQLICYHSDDFYCADGERREDEQIH